MNSSTRDKNESRITKQIKDAIANTCADNFLYASIATTEANKYLKLASFFSLVCPYANAAFVGASTATFMYFASPHLPSPLSAVGFIVSAFIGDAIPKIIATTLMTPHFTTFNKITGCDINELIASSIENTTGDEDKAGD